MTATTATQPIPKLVSNFITGVLPNMHGWCSQAKAEMLARYVLSERPTVALEIGVFAGRSLIAIALAMHENRHGIVIGIDPWDKGASIEGWENDPANKGWWDRLNHEQIHAYCVEYVKTMGVADRVKLVKTTSDVSAVAWMAASASIGSPILNFLHIDGNHSSDQALRDVTNYVPLVSQGGIVVFDDINWSTTKTAQVKLAELCDEQERVESEGQACAVFRKRIT